jgi:hypothetical protein
MRRRAPAEHVEPYRRKLHAGNGHKLRDRLAAWATQINLDDVLPDMPPEITDRPADVWEPLLAVADAAGGKWPELARVAAVALVADSKAGTPSLGVRLLADLKDVFGERDHMSTDEIIKQLCDMEEAPWGDMRGKAVDPRKLATLLKPYEVKSKAVRIGGKTLRGYAREDLWDSWIRYLDGHKETEVEIGRNTLSSKVETSATMDSVGAPTNGSATSATNATSQENGDWTEEEIEEARRERESIQTY